MNKVTHLLSLLIFISAFIACTTGKVADREENPGPSNVLVFTKTEGFRHASIPNGIEAMKQIGNNTQNLSVATTEDASKISTQKLKSYGAVVFLNTTGNVLNNSQQQALKEFIQNGGGFMGVHSATDTEYNWPWYGEMIGAYFASHPSVQEADLFVLSNSHPATQYLPGVWTRTDEWYNFRNIQEHIIPLINLHESSHEGGENGENHPIAWYHEFEGGRVFYTAGGHTTESYENSDFNRHLVGGIKYVLGFEE